MRTNSPVEAVKQLSGGESYKFMCLTGKTWCNAGNSSRNVNSYLTIFKLINPDGGREKQALPARHYAFHIVTGTALKLVTDHAGRGKPRLSRSG